MASVTNQFLAVIESETHQGELLHKWPLTPAQIMVYFECDQAIELYNLFNEIRKTLDTKAIGQLIKYPNIMTNFILNAGIIGLKEGNMIGVTHYTTKEKEDYLAFLLDIIKSLLQNDPLSGDKKNLLFSQEQIAEVMKAPWTTIDSANRGFYNGFYASLFALLWATYYNCFSNAGLEIHGPYPVTTHENNKGLMVVRDFHGLYVPDIWQTSKKLPFRHVVVYQIYHYIPMEIYFNNQLHSPEAIGVHLVSCLVEVDGKFVTDIDQLRKLDQQIEELATEQTQEVDALAPLEQVKKGAELSYFSLKPLFDYANRSWRPDAMIDKNIAQFGDKWLKKFATMKPADKQSTVELYDPRNDSLG